MGSDDDAPPETVRETGPRAPVVVQAPRKASLRETAIALAQAELGIVETATNVVKYAPKCVRHGSWIHVQGMPWCARFVCEMVWRARNVLHGISEAMGETWALTWNASNRMTSEPPIGLRAAVSEVVSDAREAGALNVTAAGVAHGGEAAGDPSYVPQLGDLLIFGRVVGGHLSSPLLGGDGHVGFFAGIDESGNWLALGGNQALEGTGGAVTIEPRHPGDILAIVALV